MASLKSWTNDKFEAAVDDGGSSSKHLTDFDGSAYDDDGDNKLPLMDNSDQQPSTFRVPIASSSADHHHQLLSAQPLGYVPNRIPSSVFSGKPANATDWSTASNESLFSIHIANGSYSKEQFFMLHKSGELTKLDEQIMAQGGNVLPPLKELDNMVLKNENRVIDEAAGGHTPGPCPRPSPVVVLGSVAACGGGGGGGNIYCQQKKFPEKVHINTAVPIRNISGRSDESTISTRSFVFPVMTGGTTEAERFSCTKGEQNNMESQAQPMKKQSTGELQPPISPLSTTAQNASRRSWFCCCGCS